MKNKVAENTILHFGTLEAKFTIFWKPKYKNKVRPNGKKSRAGVCYYLRQIADGKSKVVKIKAFDVVECRNLLPNVGGMELVTARCDWAKKFFTH